MDDMPRRAFANKWTDIEKAIMAAKEAVEAGPADVRMTDATNLLSAAFDSVADYVDGIFQRRRVQMVETNPINGREVCAVGVSGTPVQPDRAEGQG